MIPFASQRASGQDLATHLLNAHDNEQIEVASMRGAIASDLHGAFAEWEAIAHALTRCRKYLYSLSINPDPAQGPLTRSQYEDYIARVEDSLNLAGHPRAIVFHTKADKDGEPREHCHVVWSRIDADNEKAVHLAFDREKLMMVTREFARDHDLRLPEGYYRDTVDNDHHHDQLSLYEKAQQDCTGLSKEQRKAMVTNAWQQSDGARAFVRALEELGYILANGRRPYVLVDRYGETNALPKLIDDRSVRTKVIREYLEEDFPPDALPTVEEARVLAAQRNTNRENFDAVWRREIFRQEARERLASKQGERWQLLEKEKATLLSTHAAQILKLAARQQNDLNSLEEAFLAEKKKTLPEKNLFRLASVAAILVRLPGVAFLIGKIQAQTNRRRRSKYLKARTAIDRTYKRMRRALELRQQTQHLDLARRFRSLNQIEQRENSSLETILLRKERVEARLQDVAQDTEHEVDDDHHQYHSDYYIDLQEIFDRAASGDNEDDGDDDGDGNLRSPKSRIEREYPHRSSQVSSRKVGRNRTDNEKR